MAECVGKEPCPDCGSKDNLARYSDGSAWCFSPGCGRYEKGDGEVEHKDRTPSDFDPVRGDYADLPERRLFEKTLRKFGYQLARLSDGTPCHVAPLYDTGGRLVAQKLRLPGKDFRVVGDMKAATLFGQNLWEAGGKRLVVTEGEIDALSYAQASGLSWPTVSVPNGAQGAAKAIRKSLDFVESFEEVVFLFDNDEPGQQAARECAELLPPGKAKIAQLPLKDASDMLVAGQVQELKVAVYNAKTHRPDGVVFGSDIDLGLLKAVTPRGFEIPYPGLNEAIHGLRKRELVMLTAGSGIGKTTLARELGYALTVEHGQRIGWIMLEESLAKSAQALVAMDNGIPVGNLMESPDTLSPEQWDASFQRTVKPSVFYDAWGSCSVDNIIARMRYLAVGCQCDFLVLDHVSMVVSGLDVDERKTLDILMTRLRSEVCEATGVGVIAISHLRRNTAKVSFNEGGAVSVTDLRGSAAIEQLSDIVIAVERDQQSEDNSRRARIRLLKNRPFGIVGPVGYAEYIPTTGRFIHSEAPEETVEPSPFQI